MIRQSLLSIAFCLVACDDFEDQQPIEEQAHQAEITPGRIGIFTVPDSVKTTLLIAAYDEQIPQPGRTVLVYDDKTMAHATKISYLKDGSCKTEGLVKIRANEFTSKHTGETYIVTDKNVYYGNTTGNSSASFNYVRMDNDWQLRKE